MSYYKIKNAFSSKQLIYLLFDIVFYGSFLFLIYASLSLVLNLPTSFPLGGPDEPMHISMSEYIAEYWKWPQWDSHKILRYCDGASYVSTSAIIYWFHAFLYKITNIHRLGAFVFFMGYLCILAYFYRKNKIAGIAGIAFVTPQVLFTFSYVNSDVGTICIAFLLGIAVAKYLHNPNRPSNFYFFLVMSGACMLSKYHMWALGFVAFIYTLFVTRKSILRLPRRTIFVAFFLAVLIASWWPITSYFANNGDIIGFLVQEKARLLFGDPNLSPFSPSFESFPLRHFLFLTIKSFYGVWGWMCFELPGINYMVAISLLALLLFVLIIHNKKLSFFLLFLLLFNLFLMVIFSTQYDYQPQGRYLFPSYFIINGIILYNLAIDSRLPERPFFNNLLSTLSILLILLNIISISNLGKSFFIIPWSNEVSKIESSNSKPPNKSRANDELVIRRCKKILHNNPNNYIAHINLGLALERQERLEDAIDHYLEALRIKRYQPYSPMVNVRLGYILARQGDFKAAIRHYIETLRLNPDFSNTVYYNLACSYAKQNMREESIYWLKKALDKGFDNWVLIKQDEDLENIRSSEDFKAIIR